MIYKFLLLFIAFQLTILACGGPKSSTSSNPHVLVVTRAEAQKILEDDTLKCEGLACPESVAAVYILYPATTKSNGLLNVNLCSATLIAANQVLTNRHCFTDVNIKEGEGLKDKNIEIHVKFPTVSTKGFTTALGQRLIKMSAPYTTNFGPDWAVIELDQVVDRQPVTLSKILTDPESDVESQVSTGQSPLQLKMYPVYFDLNKTFGPAVIRPVECSLGRNQNNNIFSFRGDNALFNIKKCTRELVHGNSGTGVFTKDLGELLGVFADGDDGAAKTGMATMASCVSVLQPLQKRSCFFSEDKNYVQVAKTMTFSHFAYKHFLKKILDQKLLDPSLTSRKEFTWPNVSQRESAPGTVTLFWKSPWQNYSDYLVQNQAWRLKEQLEDSVANVAFALFPKCMNGFSLQLKTTTLPFVIVNYLEATKDTPENWSVEQNGKGKSKSHYLVWLDIIPEIADLNVQIERQNDHILIKGVTPQNNEHFSVQPIDKFQIQIPICN